MSEQFHCPNPWKTSKIADDNHVLPGDQDAVDEWNRKHPKKEDRVDTTLFPQPYLGSADAPVWWLLGGFGARPCGCSKRTAEDPQIRRLQQANLRDERPSQPNIWLDPNCPPTCRSCKDPTHKGAEKYADQPPCKTQGCDTCWWRFHGLRSLIEAVAAEMNAGRLEAEKLVAEKVFVLEAFPYAAPRRPGLKGLASEEFSRYLLAQEQQRTSPPILVVGRADDYWKVEAGQRVFAASNKRKATVSPGNLKRFKGSDDIDGPEIFKLIVRAVLE